MRVCYVADYGVKLSGGHQSLLNLMQDLKSYGVEPYMVCHRNWEILDIAQKNGAKTKVVSGKLYTCRKDGKLLKEYLKYPIKRILNRMNLAEAKRFLKENNIELVHLNSVLSSEMWARAAYECGVPYVWHIREFMEQDHNRMIINSGYTYKWLKRADAVIAISGAVKSYWEKVLGRELSLVYNGLPNDKYSGDANDKFKSSCVRGIVVGRIVEGKGQADAVKAVEILTKKGIKNIHLELVGFRNMTEYEKNLKKYVEDNNLTKYVDFVEFTSELNSLRESCDIGFTCSKAEAFGRVTIENMLGGLLAVGTNSGGTVELIEEGKTGFLYPPGDSAALAKIWQNAIENRELAVEIAKNGQLNAREHFLIERTVREVYEIYRRVLNL